MRRDEQQQTCEYASKPHANLTNSKNE
jgi:hypothetical protein